MSITTKTGDNGTTGLLYGGRVDKDHLVIKTVGEIDELNAWIGAAKEFNASESSVNLEEVHVRLIALMGEIATSDRVRFKDEKEEINEPDIELLEKWIHDLEDPPAQGWSTPNTFFDVACRVCRRAERSLVELFKYEEKMWTYVGPLMPIGKKPEAEYLRTNCKLRPILVVYLNRLSDLLWLLGRHGYK